MAGISPNEMKNTDRPILTSFTKLGPKTEVVLYLAETERRCRHCLCAIEPGEIYGSGMAYGFAYCADCIEIPEGVEAWKITYMGRRSPRRKDGIHTMFVVNFRETLEKYVTDLSFAVKKPVQFEQYCGKPFSPDQTPTGEYGFYGVVPAVNSGSL